VAPKVLKIISPASPPPEDFPLLKVKSPPFPPDPLPLPASMVKLPPFPLDSLSSGVWIVIFVSWGNVIALTVKVSPIILPLELILPEAVICAQVVIL
jgi:hypothetical protein